MAEKYESKNNNYWILNFFYFLNSCSCSCRKEDPPSPSSEPPVSEEVPEYEEVNYISNNANFGNTNGNIRHKSLAVYDWNKKLHYFVSGEKIYSWDPISGVTKTIVESYSEIQYLCLHGDKLFFTAGEEQYLYQANLTSSSVECVIEKEVYYVGRQFNYLYLQKEEPSLGQGGFLCYYDPNDLSLKNGINSKCDINLFGTGIFFNDAADRLDIKRVTSALSHEFSVASFENRNFTSLYFSHFLKFYNDDDQVQQELFVVRLERGSTADFYLYDSGMDELTTISVSQEITAINSDDKNVYLGRNNEIVVYDYIEREHKEYITFQEGIKISNLFVVNQYMYFTDSATGDFYRYHPDWNVPVKVV